jgi:hypothetical protein
MLWSTAPRTSEPENCSLTGRSSRPAPAGNVSLGRGTFGIFASQAYAACLRGSAQLNVRPQTELYFLTKRQNAHHGAHMTTAQTLIVTVAPAASAASGVANMVPTIEQWRAVMFDRLLILVTLAGIAILIIYLARLVIGDKDKKCRTRDEPDTDSGAQEKRDGHAIEIKKIHFAAVTLTGILVLVLFTSLLYFLDESKNGEIGKEIFKNTLTALTPIVGVIVGYIFGKK